MIEEYYPEVLQAIPTDDYTVYVYFDDGRIKLFDAKELVTKGIFKPLQDIKKFKSTCTVLNNTLAWDLQGNYDTTKCLDIDPFVIYNDYPEVEEPTHLFNNH
ncbi:MAG: hypothetical protein ATN35_04305 [Epulopiscium sp. Nele67-Bin004]|nr:MAG: hypothetical protein ATN35_04305 [Epulopiscium sp. Nele67-Bin004]